jgi:multidrug efflux pump subunit AcrA (membrane-fusion protein)
MMKYVLTLLALGALGFAGFFVIKNSKEDSITVMVRPAAVKIPGAVLAGTGIVEPVTGNIAVGSPLPGLVVEVIDQNSEVGKTLKKDTLLFRLDDRNLKADLEVKKAALAASKAQLVRLKDMPRKEELPPLEWKLEQANLDKIDADKKLNAAKQMQPGSISKEELGKRKHDVHFAMATVAKAETDLALLKAGAWKPDLEVSRAAVFQAQTQVDQAKTELERLEVRAKQACTLLQVNVRIGEFVGAQPNQNLIVLGDLKHLYVRVDVDEHDAPRFRPSMAAVGYLRGQPDIHFPMEYVRTEPYFVPRKSLTGDVSERVDTRVLQVIYRIKEEGRSDVRDKIHVGQQLDVFIGDLNAVPQKKTAGQ